jgi:hypothetical protein
MFINKIISLIEFITALPKDFEDREGLKHTIKNFVSTVHPMYKYLELHLNVVFADLEKPRDKFESCVAVIKDMERMDFAKILERIAHEKIDSNLQALLSSKFSVELLHKVQKAMRDDSFERDFKLKDDS